MKSLFNFHSLVIFLAVLLAVTIGFGPKGSQVVLLVFAISGIYHAIKLKKMPPLHHPNWLLLFLLAVFSLVSASWSLAPEITIKFSWRLLIILLCTCFALFFIQQLTTDSTKNLYRSLSIAWVLGGTVASLIVVFYLLTYEMGYKVPFFVECCDYNDIARQIAKSLVLTALFLFPLFDGIREFLGKGFQAFLAIFFLVFLIADSQSAFLALTIGLITHGLSKTRPRLFFNLTIFAFIVSFVLVIPMIEVNNLVAKQDFVQNFANDNPVAYRERTQIYNYYSDQVMNAPLFGHGYFAGRANLMESKGFGSPHNIQLQILFDIGAVGAAIIIVFVLLLGQKIKRNTNPSQTRLVAAFLAALLMASAFNFVIWQPWLLSAIAVATILFALRSATLKE